MTIEKLIFIFFLVATLLYITGWMNYRFGYRNGYHAGERKKQDPALLDKSDQKKYLRIKK